jgi:hypothetical protein
MELPLVDLQVARELAIVAANFRDEALGILATDERLDRIAERLVGRRAHVEDGENDRTETIAERSSRSHPDLSPRGK